jgi:hypothetical protein
MPKGCIERKNAIKLIWTIARSKGLDKDSLSESLIDWGFGDNPHLSVMEAKQLSEILSCLGANLFVREPGYVIWAREEASRCGVSRDHMNNIITNHFKYRSLYQFPQRKCPALAKCLNYYKTNQGGNIGKNN